MRYCADTISTSESAIELNTELSILPGSNLPRRVPNNSFWLHPKTLKQIYQRYLESRAQGLTLKWLVYLALTANS